MSVDNTTHVVALAAVALNFVVGNAILQGRMDMVLYRTWGIIRIYAETPTSARRSEDKFDSPGRVSSGLVDSSTTIALQSTDCFRSHAESPDVLKG